MLNHFLAVSTLVLSIVYFTLVGATSKARPPKDKLSPERRQKISIELDKQKLTPTSLGKGDCFDIKTPPLSPFDQMVVQIPQAHPTKEFDVFVSAFKGDEKIWLSNFKCKKQHLANALCVSEDGAGNFKLDWTKEKSDLMIRTISFGTFESPGPILSPRDGHTALELNGEAISCS